MIKRYSKMGWDVRERMFGLPFKDPEVERLFSDGLIMAGFPGEPGGYYKIRPEHKLTGKEIKDLVFGRTAIGLDVMTKKQWEIDRTEDGGASYRGPRGYVKGEPSEVEETSDSGFSWIEGDRICNKWEKLYGGFKDCWTVYRNSEGTPEKNDDYGKYCALFDR